MTTADWAELETLTTQFVNGPISKVPLTVLHRLDILTQQLANDPEMPEARRLTAIVLRAAVRWYLGGRHVPPVPQTSGSSDDTQ